MQINNPIAIALSIAFSDIFERCFVFHISCEDMMDKEDSFMI